MKTKHEKYNNNARSNFQRTKKMKSNQGDRTEVILQLRLTISYRVRS